MEWVLSLCLLYAKHSKSTSAKAVPLGGRWRRQATEGGELALKPRLPPNQRTYPSDCKAGARKSRPPWGKVAPTGDGRGELALNPRLPHNQRTYPSDCKAGASSQTKTAPQQRHRTKSPLNGTEGRWAR